VVPVTVDWKVDWTRQVAGGQVAATRQVAPLPDSGDHWQGKQSVTVGEVFVPCGYPTTEHFRCEFTRLNNRQVAETAEHAAFGVGCR